MGLGLDAGSREFSLGWNLSETRPAGLLFNMSLEGSRRESLTGNSGAENRVGLGLGWQLRGMQRKGFTFGLDLEGERRDTEDDGRDPKNRIGLALRIAW